MAEHRFGRLVGMSPPMKEVYAHISRVAPTNATVLIVGESGTGKELVARTLHDLSRRRHGPYVALNCSALSPMLIESELFGHERGSFTRRRSTAPRMRDSDLGTAVARVAVCGTMPGV